MQFKIIVCQDIQKIFFLFQNAFLLSKKKYKYINSLIEIQKTSVSDKDIVKYCA